MCMVGVLEAAGIVRAAGALGAVCWPVLYFARSVRARSENMLLIIGLFCVLPDRSNSDQKTCL